MATEAAPAPTASPGELAQKPNLTAAQLVKRQDDTSPQPNHSLVICKKIESGYVIRRFIPPNKVFRPFLQGSSKLFFAFAVPHGNKWLSFTRTYSTTEPTPEIRLSFTLTYQVEHPAKLVEMLGDDPLQTLQSTAEAEFDRVIQQLTWANPLMGGMALERFSLPEAQPRRMGNNEAIIASLFRLLQDLALEYGLLVNRLAISRDLSAQERVFLEKREQLRHEEELQHFRHRITLKESTFNELLGKLRLLISRVSGPGSEEWTEAIKELREFVKILEELVALPSPGPAPLASAAKNLPGGGQVNDHEGEGPIPREAVL